MKHQTVTCVVSFFTMLVMARTLVAAGPRDAEDAPLEVSSRLELMVDDHLIESLQGDARQVLHRPVLQDIAIEFDAPWVGNGSNYPTVFRDGELYRMYYRGRQIGLGVGIEYDAHPVVTCYAESRDGIHWEKPKLGLFEFEGSKENNIVWTGHGSHNFTPFKDANPDAPPDAKYKAVGGEGVDGGLLAFVSPDGIRWKRLQDKPLIDPALGNFDSQKVVFWDAERELYRIYFRDSREGRRDTKTATSHDFQQWSESQFLDYPGAPPEELYTNQIKPYARAPHLFIGLPTRYVDHGTKQSINALPELEHRRLRATNQQRYGSALTDTLLMTSRDGNTFSRWNKTFLPPGPKRPVTWNYGHLYTAWGMVETAPRIDGMPNELSIYATEGAWTGSAVQLRRYTLRMDGFVSVSSAQSGGELRTKPLIFQGKDLVLNMATSAAGSVHIELQDTDGNAINGFTAEECLPLLGDTIDRVVLWNGSSDISTLAGTPIRLRFVLHDAELYSLRFRK